jgi:acetyltransferase-like isoleucine patch superfamily enzyme
LACKWSFWLCRMSGWAILIGCILIFTLTRFSHTFPGGFYHRILSLLASILMGRLVDSILPPLVAICLKWIIIGRYKPGTYRMWVFLLVISPTKFSIEYGKKVVLILSTMVDRQSDSEVNSSISINYSLILRLIFRIAGLGIFAANGWLITTYYRLLGARIGRDVHIGESMRLYECDLLTLQDGCRLDTQTLRGFCVEREGYFRLAPITIGTKAVINAYTNISPGSKIEDGAVYGPHMSSYETPSEESYAAYNRTLLSDPSWPLRILIAWPIISIVIFISCKYVSFFLCHLLISLFRYSVDLRYLRNDRPPFPV